VDYVTVNCNITTAGKIADTVRAIYLAAALKDKNFGFYRSSDNPALYVKVEIREVADGCPDWAKPVEKEGDQPW
jgi:hypothetical protein